MTQMASLLRKLKGISPSVQRADIADDGSKRADAQTAAGVNSTTPAKPSPFRKRNSPPAAKKLCTETVQEDAPVRKKNSRQSDTTARILNSLSIPCPDPTLEERTRDAHQNHALRLVRQEDWEKLSGLINEADRNNTMTPGGMSVAELLAFGARADVVMAAEHALLDSVPEHDAPLMRGIEALEFVLAEYPDDYIIGCIVAHAHMDMAWAWRGIGWDVEIAPRNREAFDAHFARARDIVKSLRNAPKDSALLASTSCALLRGDNISTKSIADRYEALINLNPENTSPLRALGTHMLPRWYGTYQELELEARRTAARTQQIWGAGGYTWVMFDAISVDDEACARLDLPFFMEGLHDIVMRRPDPHTVNLLAAYCANTMGQAYSGNDAADHIRAQIAACARWIVREHLTELHPMIWAHAAQGFVNNLRVSSASRFAAAGQDDALRIIAGLFKREIAEGKRIIFTDEGPIATAV
ncbi:hypothetical protein OS189_08095 [Sulfitobacter sp. F26169L]|uniref:hypothetical protein n=1 Tax=Sulfitobacter sp. F26169L TaxID=2996015 RepID=UPI002260E54E|nr:hypothetical protein [Sulfitobacter sp. F26169L]MCX7566302.1 hypothetical protein [Sulfitobacter sp. F26169L]